MDLIEQLSGEPQNLLPYDGVVQYYGAVIPLHKADQYLKDLLDNIAWKNDEAVIFGRKIIASRKVAWYAQAPFTYTYSNSTKTALPWTQSLLELKSIAEEVSGETYNSCLLNLYHDGSEGMAWHSDGEKDLKKNGAIASMSFGVERKFAFKHKRSKATISQVLGHGSVLVMRAQTQSYWLHRLPPTKLVHSARVNLTFRTIVDQSQGVNVNHLWSAP